MSGVNLQFDPEDLRPLIEAVVAEAVARSAEAHGTIGGKLAYGEAEAARLLSLEQHQLRDERLRGRIKASVGPGKKILYTREDLLNYLASRRWEPANGHIATGAGQRSAAASVAAH